MNWFKNLKVSIKLNAFIVTCIIVSFAVLVSVILMQTYQTSKQTAEELAIQLAHENAAFIQSSFEKVVSQLTSMKDDLLHLQAHGLATREYVISLLEHSLKNNPEILGFYTFWEPNKFDGLDSQYRNRPYHDETGRFLPYVVRSGDQIILQPLTDAEVQVGDYYQIPKNTKKIALTDPYYYAVDGRNVLMTSLVVPILDTNGSFVGVIGVDITLTAIQEAVSVIKPMGGFATLVAQNGIYLAHGFNSEQVMQPFANTEDKRAIVDQITRGEEISLYRNSNELNAEVLSVFHPVQIEGSDSIWSLETVIEKKEIFKQFNRLLNLGLIISISTVIVVIIGLILIIRWILRPLKPATLALEQMATGNFTYTLNENVAKDEFGMLLHSVSSTVDSLVQSISGVIRQSDNLATTANSLSNSADDTLKATKEIAVSIQEVANGAESQLQSTEESLQALEEVAQGIQHIAERTSIVSDQSRETVTYTKEGNEAIQKTLNQMNEITKAVDYTGAVIKELESRSDKIGQIVTAITEISSQTNLLALNAAIEAARAGESGRGFAVVADEVRKLAEQSNESAAQISQLIHDIQMDTKKSVEAMEIGTKEVASGVELVNQASEAFARINVATRNVVEQVEEVSASLEQISATSQEVTASVGALTQIAQTAASSSQNVAASSEEQLAAVNEMTMLIGELNKVSIELKQMMDQFTISK